MKSVLRLCPAFVLVLPCVVSAQAVWYGASGRLAPEPATASWGDETEVAVSSRMALRAQMLTRSPAPDHGPSVRVAGIDSRDRLAFLADYRLRGPVRLTGGLAVVTPARLGSGYDGGLAASNGRAAGDGASISSYLGLGFRQRAVSDRGWDVRGDIGLALGRQDQVAAGLAASSSGDDRGLSGLSTSSGTGLLAADRKTSGLRVSPQFSLGARYRY